MKSRLASSAITGLVLAIAGGVRAQPNPTPTNQIPPAILAALKNLENQFDLALAQDCAPERCFSKGCVYGDHAIVDKPRTASLPGLGEAQGPGSVAAQEYLTQARCEFTHEKAVPARDVKALVNRLQQKLSKGWLVVTVGTLALDPVSPKLRESVAPKEPEPEPAAPPAPPPEPPAPLVNPEWDPKVAVRELWLSLLPHFSWMIALVLVTLAALTIIWALRRLGRESIEEKAMLAQLMQEGAPGLGPNGAAKSAEPASTLAESEEQASLAQRGDESEFVDEQKRAWSDRIAGANLANDDSVIVELLREWLKNGEFELLAKAVFVFSDRLPLAFPDDGELAVRKIEFAEYLRTLDEQRLPSDADFFRKLNHHAISSSLLAQSDAEIYRSLREEFGAGGIAELVEALPARQAALLFALTPADYQHETARLLSRELKVAVAEQLMLSNRVSKDEIAKVFEALRAARAGQPLPRFTDTGGITDRGRELDAAGALSVLLPHLTAEDRSALFGHALDRSRGSLPLWYEGIMFGDMLLKIPSELQTDMLLDVDIRSLAGWYSLQQPAWQDAFMRRLAPPMQSALRASMAFGSRADQLALARRGRTELASALQKLVARGKVAFADIVV